jgi:peptidoglycan hydrolase-like protein with peptidoglycan-binding domain
MVMASEWLDGYGGDVPMYLPCTVFEEQGYTGDCKSAVKSWQTFLATQGYNLGSGCIDGVYGTKTKNATKAFQSAHGLSVDPNGYALVSTVQKAGQILPGNEWHLTSAQRLAACPPPPPEPPPPEPTAETTEFTPQVSKSRTPGLPFYDIAGRMIALPDEDRRDNKEYMVTIALPADGNLSDVIGNLSTFTAELQEEFTTALEAVLPELKKQATEAFILYYFPEYFSSLGTDVDVEGTTGDTDYESVYKEIYTKLEYMSILQPHTRVVRTYANYSKDFVPTAASVLFSLGAFELFEYRLSRLSSLPPFEDALAEFNLREQRTASTMATDFPILQIEEKNQKVGLLLDSFAQQVIKHRHALNFQINFTFLKDNVENILNWTTTLLKENVGPPGGLFAWTDQDSFTIYFDAQDKISKIGYNHPMMADPDQLLKVGYFSHLVYDPLYNDEILNRTLQYYQEATEQGEECARCLAAGVPAPPIDRQPSFEDFIKEVYHGMPHANAPVDFSAENPIQPVDLGIEEKLPPEECEPPTPILTPYDTPTLDFAVPYTLLLDELQLLFDMAEDPEILGKMYEEESRKSIQTTPKAFEKLNGILGRIDTVLSGDLSFGNPQVAQVLSSFGLDQLAKEALLCAMFGANVSFERLGTAIQGVISQNYYSIPTPPREIVWPEIPPLKFEFKFQAPNKPDINFQDEIVRALMDALIQLGFTLITSLADLLREACAALRNEEELEGTVDTPTLFVDNLSTGAQNPLTSYNYSNLFKKYGFRSVVTDLTGDVMLYLADLSVILTPLDNCQLLTIPAKLPRPLLDKILTFNLNYYASSTPWGNEPDMGAITAQIVRETFNNYNSIVSFFTDLASMVDASKLCNVIARETIIPSIQDICLDEGVVIDTFFEESNIASLLDVIEKGPTLKAPRIDFMCPDSADYMENPFFTRTLPRMFNSVLTTVETQFAYALVGAKGSILQTKMSSRSAAADSMQELNRYLPPGARLEVPPPPHSTQGLTDLVDAFEGLQDALTVDDEGQVDMGFFNACRADLLKFLPNPQALDVLIDLLSEINESVSFDEVNRELQEVEATLAEASGSGGMVFTTYSFPRNFKKAFQDVLPSVPEGVSTSPAGLSVFKAGAASAQPAGTTLGSYPGLWMNFHLPPPYQDQVIKATYLGYESGAQENSYINFSIPSYFSTGEGVGTPTTISIPPWGSQTQNLSSTNENPEIDYFTEGIKSSIYRTFENLGIEAPANEIEELETSLQSVYFPSAFMGLTERMFDHCVKNGIFNVLDVNRLNLFKDNNGCPPEEAGDLLDADGILEQMKQEMVAAACHDGHKNTGSQIRDTIKYGLLNLFIQISLVEFIVKNIFVFTAFTFNDLVSIPVIKKLIASSVTEGIIATMESGTSTILATQIRNHFDTLVARPNVAANGGLFYSDSGPNDTPFWTLGTDAPSVNAMVEFLVSERLSFTWTPNAAFSSTRSTMQSINNVLKGQKNPASFDHIMINEIVGITDPYLGLLSSSMAPASFEYGPHPGHREASGNSYGRLGIEKVVTWSGIEAFQGFATVPLATQGLGPEPVQFDIELTPGGRQSGEMPIAIFRAMIESMAEGDFGGATFHDVKCGYRLVYYAPTSAPNPLLDNIYGQALGMNLGGVHAYSEAELTAMSHAVDTDGDGVKDATQYSVDPEEMQQRLETNVYPAIQAQIAAAAQSGFVDTPITRYDFDDPGYEIYPFKLRNIPSDILNLGSLSTWSLTPVVTERLKSFQVYTSPAELTRISNSIPVRRLLSGAFNEQMILLIPLLYNTFYTNKYFSRISRNFVNPKKAVLDLFIETTLNAGGAQPIPVRRGSQDTIDSLATNGGIDFESMAREFIIKMAVDTPIDILKSVLEMADPHWAVSGNVKKVTSFAFAAVEAAIGAALSQVPDELQQALDVVGIDLTAENIMSLLLCLVDTAASGGLDSLPLPPPALVPNPDFDPDEPLSPNNQPNHPDPNHPGPGATLGDLDLSVSIGPRISRDGVDFSGSVAGIFMAMPTPFGIAGILLQILQDVIHNLLESESQGDEEADGPLVNIDDTTTANECE